MERKDPIFTSSNYICPRNTTICDLIGSVKLLSLTITIEQCQQECGILWLEMVHLCLVHVFAPFEDIWVFGWLRFKENMVLNYLTHLKNTIYIYISVNSINITIDMIKSMK